MVLGGQPTPCFLPQNSRKSNFFTLPVVHARTIVRSSPDGVEGTLGVIFLCALFEAVGANAFCNFWLPLTMGRNKMALAGHPTPCETRLLDLQKKKKKVLASVSFFFFCTLVSSLSLFAGTAQFELISTLPLFS